MKRFLISVIILLFCAHSIFAQSSNELISIDVQNKALDQVLKEISDKYKVQFAYDPVLLSKTNVSASFTIKSIDDVLFVLLDQTTLCWNLIGETYTIYPCPQKSKLIQNVFFEGIIKDHESGEPLPFANIVYKDSLGTTSNELGLFSIPIKDQNPFNIKITYIGYQGIDSLLLSLDAQELYQFELKRLTLQIKSFTVVGEQSELIEKGEDAGSLVFNPHMTNYLPNLGEADVLNALNILPGISNIGNTEGLSIRGSLPQSNLILLDGFPVYNLNHFLGNISTVNPKYVKNVRLSKGGFGANYGGSIAGIVDITGKTGNRYKPSFDLSVNLLSANMLTEIPIGDHSTLLFAGRKSYTEFLKTYLYNKLFNVSKSKTNIEDIQNEDNEASPRFNYHDYHIKYTLHSGEKEKLAFSFFSSADKLDYGYEEDYTFFEFSVKDDQRWTNKGVSLDWSRQHSSRFYSQATLGYSDFQNKHNTIITYSEETDNGTQLGEETFSDENSIKGIQLNFQNTYTYSEKAILDFGVHFRNHSIRAFYGYDTLEEEVYNIEFDDKTNTYTFFGELELKPTPDLNIKPGLRATYLELNEEIYWQPRFSMIYHLSDNLEFHSEFGLYYQFISNVTQIDNLGNVTNYWILGHDGVNPSKSVHLQGGLNYFTRDWFISLELYSRRSKGIAISYLQFSEEFQENVYLNDFNGKEHASGLDLLIKKRFNQFTGIVSFSYGNAQTQFDEINNGNFYPANNDRKFQWTLSGIYRSGPWHFSYQWSYATGNPFTDFSQAQTNYNTNRLPDYHKLDLAAVYSFRNEKLRGEMGVSLLNIYNKKNIIRKKFVDVSDFENEFNIHTTNIVTSGFLPVFFINLKF